MREARRHGILRLVALAIGSQAAPAAAHQGPPFPLVVDAHTANHIVSIWTDPDIGEARFFIIVEAPDGQPATDDAKVSMWVQPLDGRLERKDYPATRDTLKNVVQFAAAPYFDRQDKWKIGVRIESPGKDVEELTAEVESTPPGLGPWDLAVYSFPFLLVGGLWAIGVLRQRSRRSRAALPHAAP